ncbi:MAG TPA: hypothetical protein GX747_03220, partial [Tenericutes bacterium]|nr:hypothetical protein [Mycoplasmatota bacterium]
MNKKNIINFVQTILILFSFFIDVENFVKIDYKKFNGNINLILIFVFGIFTFNTLKMNKEKIKCR